nr:MAG TPA: hypothetical protein [Caudoviricetes sp.]
MLSTGQMICTTSILVHYILARRSVRPKNRETL